MTGPVLTLVLLALGAPQGAPSSRTAEAAKAFEEAAFVAIDEAHWCDAARLFLQAEGMALNPTLLVNAAEAALEGGDRQLAVELLTRAEGRSTKREKRRLKRRRRQVESALKKTGSTATCDLTFQPLPVEADAAPAAQPPPDPTPTPQPAAVEPAPSAEAPSAVAPDATAPPPRRGAGR